MADGHVADIEVTTCTDGADHVSFCANEAETLLDCY